MMNIILQRVSLQASPEALFDTYLDSKKHAAVIGRKVTIKRAVGARFVAFDGIIAFDCTRCSRTGCISRITAGSIGWLRDSEPDGCTRLHGLRQHHDSQWRLLQVPQLRRHQRL